MDSTSWCFNWQILMESIPPFFTYNRLIKYLYFTTKSFDFRFFFIVIWQQKYTANMYVCMYLKNVHIFVSKGLVNLFACLNQQQKQRIE